MRYPKSFVAASVSHLTRGCSHSAVATANRLRGCTFRQRSCPFDGRTVRGYVFPAALVLESSLVTELGSFATFFFVGYFPAVPLNEA